MTEDNETITPEAPKKKAPRVKLQSASGEPVKAAKSAKTVPAGSSKRAKVELDRNYRSLDDQTMQAMSVSYTHLTLPTILLV